MTSGASASDMLFERYEPTPSDTSSNSIRIRHQIRFDDSIYDDGVFPRGGSGRGICGEVDDVEVLHAVAERLLLFLLLIRRGERNALYRFSLGGGSIWMEGQVGNGACSASDTSLDRSIVSRLADQLEVLYELVRRSRGRGRHSCVCRRR
jgi:hypothetical protein